MNTIKRVMALIVAMLMLVSVAVGCGSKQEDKANEGNSSNNTQQGGEQASNQKIKLNYYMSAFERREQEYYEKMKQEFEKQYPNVELNMVPAIKGNANEKADKLTVMLVGGEKIDTFDANQVEYFKFATMGLFNELDDLAKKDNFDFDKLGKDTVQASRIDGKLYALPVISSYWMVYYNKNLFDDAGVPYPKDDWTWEDFRETAKKLTKGDGPDKIWGFTGPDWATTWASIGTQAGATFVDESGMPSLDDEKFRYGLQLKYNLTMVDKSGPTLAENKLTKVHYAKAFSAGNVAMVPIGQWMVDQIKTNLDGNYTFEYDVAKMPRPEGAEEGTTWGAARYVGMNKNLKGETKEAAWNLLKHFASDSVAKMIAGTNALPAVLTPEVIAEYKKNVPDFVTNIDIMFEDHKHVAEKPFHAFASQIDKVMKEESDLVLTGAKSVDDAIKDMQKRAVAEVKKATAK